MLNRERIEKILAESLIRVGPGYVGYAPNPDPDPDTIRSLCELALKGLEADRMREAKLPVDVTIGAATFRAGVDASLAIESLKRHLLEYDYATFQPEDTQ